MGVEDRLPSGTTTLVQEFLDAGEFALAVETMAEMLSEYEREVSTEERSEFLRLVGRMAMEDRVSRSLAFCPDRS
jgi:hypothetical protein